VKQKLPLSLPDRAAIFVIYCFRWYIQVRKRSSISWLLQSDLQ